MPQNRTCGIFAAAVLCGRRLASAVDTKQRGLTAAPGRHVLRGFALALFAYGKPEERI